MADDATTPARATVASATALAEQALESAQLAHQVGEAQAADLTEQAKVLANIQKEQLALAKLVNGLNEQKGSLVKPSQLDGILARLEKVEQNTKGATYDWKPAIDKLGHDISEVQASVNSVARGLGEAVISDGGASAKEVTDKVVAVVDAVENLHRFTTTIAEQSDAFQANVYQRLTQVEQGMRTANTLGVGGKVLELMKEVEFIGKNRKAEIEGRRGDDFSYMFRGIDDAQDAVGSAMRKVGLIMRTQVVEKDYQLTPMEKKFANGGSMTQLWSTCVLTMRYAFVDPADMSEFAFEMVGEGKDVSDKSASKAASMACKYALFQALMIPVKGVVESDGEDPQITGDTEPERPAQTAQPAAQNQVPAQPAPPVDQAARKVRATAAVQAVKVLHQLPDAQDAMGRLEKITAQVKREGLADVQVDEYTVGVWITSQWKVLHGLLSTASRGADQGATRQDVDPQAPAQQQAQEPPPAEPPASDDPWGNYTPPPGSEF